MAMNTYKDLLDQAIDQAARDRKAGVGFYDAVTSACEDYGVDWGDIQKGLSARASRKSRGSKKGSSSGMSPVTSPSVKTGDPGAESLAAVGQRRAEVRIKAILQLEDDDENDQKDPLFLLSDGSRRYVDFIGGDDEFGAIWEHPCREDWFISDKARGQLCDHPKSGERYEIAYTIHEHGSNQRRGYIPMELLDRDA